MRSQKVDVQGLSGLTTESCRIKRTCRYPILFLNPGHHTIAWDSLYWSVESILAFYLSQQRALYALHEVELRLIWRKSWASTLIRSRSNPFAFHSHCGRSYNGHYYQHWVLSVNKNAWGFRFTMIAVKFNNIKAVRAVLILPARSQWCLSRVVFALLAASNQVCERK